MDIFTIVIISVVSFIFVAVSLIVLFRKKIFAKYQNNNNNTKNSSSDDLILSPDETQPHSNSQSLSLSPFQDKDTLEHRHGVQYQYYVPPKSSSTANST